MAGWLFCGCAASGAHVMKPLLKRIVGGLFILGFDVVIAAVGVFPGRGATVTAKDDPLPRSGAVLSCSP